MHVVILEQGMTAEALFAGTGSMGSMMGLNATLPARADSMNGWVHTLQTLKVAYTNMVGFQEKQQGQDKG